MASAMQEFLILVRYQRSNPIVSQNWTRALEEGLVMRGTEETESSEHSESVYNELIRYPSGCRVSQ